MTLAALEAAIATYTEELRAVDPMLARWVYANMRCVLDEALAKTPAPWRRLVKTKGAVVIDLDARRRAKRR